MIHTIYSKEKPILGCIYGFVVTVLFFYFFLEMPSELFKNTLIICFILFLLITPIRKGIEINTKKKEYRTITLYLSFKIGKWKNLNDGAYLSLFKNESFTDNNPMSGGPKHSIKYQLNLFDIEGNYVTIVSCESLKTAIFYSNKVKTILNLNILDATTSDYKWVDHF